MNIFEFLELEEDPSDLYYPYSGFNSKPLFIVALYKLNDHKDKLVIESPILQAFVHQGLLDQLMVYNVSLDINILNTPSMC